MKLLFLPPQPLLTKRGTVRKRARGLTRGRLFFADGHELPGIASIALSSEPVEFALTQRQASVVSLVIEFANPDVELIDKPPTPAR
jgi:hypothetical protein